MLCGMQLTYGEIIQIFDIQDFAGSTKGYALPHIFYEVNDLNLMLKSILPTEVKVILKLTILD